MIARTVFLLVLVLTAKAVAQEATATHHNSGGSPQRRVSVSARSMVVTPPDQVQIRFAVHTEDRKLPIARAANDDLTRAVFNMLDQLQIPREDVQVTNLTVERARNDYRVLMDYEVDRSFSVRVRKFELIEPFLSGLFDTGVTDIDDLTFELRDQRPQLREARRKAFEYAKEKATELADLSGLVLGDVISVDEKVQYNFDVEGAGGMGGMGGFGGVTRLEPQADSQDSVPVQQQPAVTPPRKMPTVYRVAFPMQQNEPLTGTPDTQTQSRTELELLAPGVVRLDAIVNVTFEMHKRAPAATDQIDKR
jgi:uncharacterized protein YggE